MLNSKKEKVISERTQVRILVVDDFAPWQRFVAARLQEQRRFRIIGVASDGIEAIRKVEDLRPDLILMDVGLPKLNGVEAARQILKLVPKSKILFVSQNPDADVARFALATGARGFVTKSDAHKELLVAVAAVISGNQYVSRKLAGHVYADPTDTQASDHLRLERATGLLPLRGTERNRGHEALFYSGEALFLDSFTRFVQAALRADDAVIVVATEVHRKMLFDKLLERDIDVWDAVERGSYISLDAADTLSTFMVKDMPDTNRFMRVVGDLVVTAAKRTKGEHGRVAACGECAPLLWTDGKEEAAVRLEQLWNDIAKTFDVDILCGYPMSGFDQEKNSAIYHRICAEHSSVCSC